MARMLIALLIVSAASLAVAQIAPGGTAPHFTLSDVNDREFSSETQRTKPLFVIFSTKDLGDASLAWRDSLSAAELDVEIETVIDLSDVSRLLRSIARSRIQDAGSVALLDWNGEVSQSWRGKERSQVVVMIADPANRVSFAITGDPTSENLNAAIASVRADASIRAE